MWGIIRLFVVLKLRFAVTWKVQGGASEDVVDDLLSANLSKVDISDLFALPGLIMRSNRSLSQESFLIYNRNRSKVELKEERTFQPSL